MSASGRLLPTIAIGLARNEIYAIAQRLNMPMKDLIGTGIRKTTGKVAVQYRNPANATEEWTGGGRRRNGLKSSWHLVLTCRRQR